MRKLLVILILAATVMVLAPISVNAEGLPVTNVEFIRKLLLQPDNDFSIFDKTELCNAFIYLIEYDDNDVVVEHAVASLWVTEDERAIPILIENIENYPLHCLYGLGYFSTPKSCNALLAHIGDDDEFNRRFAAQSLGKLDFTVSEEMWELRDDVLNGLTKRLSLETEEWIHPILNKAIAAIDAQVFAEDESSLGK